MRRFALRDPFKTAVLLALLLPAAWAAAGYQFGTLGAQPIRASIDTFGLWTLRLAFIALAITPLRQILRWPRLTLVRRNIGVAAFAYGATHLSLYTADQMFDLFKVASEIALRYYLTIGFVALLGLAALAATSTDRMVRRLGPRGWQLLHRLVYPIAVLAAVHFCLQSKLEEWEPTMMAGFLAWLLGYRLLVRVLGARGGLAAGWLAALGLAAATLTGLGEVGYFWWLSGADPLRILSVEFTMATGIRPAAVVLAAGLGVTVAAAIRAPRRRMTARRPPVPATSPG